MTNSEVFLSPDAVRHGANNFETAANSLSQAWSTFCATAATLNVDSTWGTDDAGKTFNEEYLGGEKPVQQLLASTADMVTLINKLGPDVKSCVQGTVDADDLVATWFPDDES